MSRRKCIFTGEDSDFKLNIAQEDHHNWAKSVPTTKKYYERHLYNRDLNELEMRQIELFFQLELCMIKQLKLHNRMEDIQKLLYNGIGSFDEKAYHVSGVENVTTVSEQDWDKLQDHIENPPEPTPALKEAFEKYKEIALEVNGETIEAAQKVAYEYEPTVIDEPEDLDIEAVEKMLENPLKTHKEAKVLSTPKKDDKIEKKKVVKKKKPTLWD